MLRSLFLQGGVEKGAWSSKASYERLEAHSASRTLKANLVTCTSKLLLCCAKFETLLAVSLRAGRKTPNVRIMVGSKHATTRSFGFARSARNTGMQDSEVCAITAVLLYLWYNIPGIYHHHV